MSPLRKVISRHCERSEVGSSNDGGYYLIGLKRVIPDLFEDIPWSTKDVLDATLKKCHEKHLTTHLLPSLTDIDTLDDIYLLDDEIRDFYLHIINQTAGKK